MTRSLVPALQEGASGTADHLTFLIQCGNGTRFYLDEVEIEDRGLPAIEGIAPTRVPDESAIQICEDHVRVGLPFPSFLRRDFLSTGVFRSPGGDAVVEFEFDAVNGFGFPLAFQVQCVLTGHELARLELTPRRAEAQVWDKAGAAVGRKGTRF